MADGIGGAGLAGAGAGALKGASIGSAISPGVGTAVGAVGGALIGGLAGANKKREAVRAMNNLQTEDPEERAMQRYFARRKRAYSTGTADNMNRSALRAGLQSGVANAFKYGAPTRGIRALNEIYQQGLMGLNAQGIQGANVASQQESAVSNNMIQRRLELALLKASQKSAESAQQTTEDKQNMGVGLMKGFDELASGMKGIKGFGGSGTNSDLGVIGDAGTGSSNLLPNTFSQNNGLSNTLDYNPSLLENQVSKKYNPRTSLEISKVLNYQNQNPFSQSNGLNL